MNNNMAVRGVSIRMDINKYIHAHVLRTYIHAYKNTYINTYT